MNEEIFTLKRELEKSIDNSTKVLDIFKKLTSIPMTFEVLHSTHIGATVNKVRRSSDNQEVIKLGKSLVKKWKNTLHQSSSASSSSATANNNLTNNEDSTSNANSNHSSSNNGSSTNAATISNSNNINASNSTSNNNSNSNHANSFAEKGPAKTSGDNNNNGNKTSSSAGNGSQASRSSTVVPGQSSTASNQDDPGKPSTSSGSDKTKKPHLVQAEVPHTTDEVRLKLRQMLTNALRTPLPKEHKDEAFLDEEMLAVRIEECIFREFKATDIKYKNRCRSRVLNLQDSKNPYLRLNVLRGDIPAEKIAKMTAEEMASDELKRQREIFTKEAINDHQMALTSGTKTSEIKCNACKKYDVTYNQVQTRSADEPMTTFCFCNNCGKRWKFC